MSAASGILSFQRGGQSHDDVLTRIELGAQIVYAHERRYASSELLAADRLGQEIVRAMIERPDLFLRRSESRQHHDRHPAALGRRLDPRAGLETVHSRHHHVEQDQGGGVLFEQLDRLETISADDHLIAPLPKVLLDELEILLVVVDRENQRFRTCLFDVLGSFRTHHCRCSP